MIYTHLHDRPSMQPLWQINFYLASFQHDFPFVLLCLQCKGPLHRFHRTIMILVQFLEVWMQRFYCCIPKCPNGFQSKIPFVYVPAQGTVNKHNVNLHLQPLWNRRWFPFCSPFLGRADPIRFSADSSWPQNSLCQEPLLGSQLKPQEIE